jgi:hypothetical protein
MHGVRSKTLPLRKKVADLKDRLCLQEYGQALSVCLLTAGSKARAAVVLGFSGNSGWNSVL